MSNKEKDFYEILNLSRGCKSEDIKRSFIDMSKEYHPDRHPNLKYSHEKFLDICEAYNTLNDPSKRKQYDQLLLHRSRVIHKSSNAYGFGFSHSTSNTSNSAKLTFKLSALPKAVMFATLVFISLIGAGIQFHFLNSDFDAKKVLLENKSVMSGIIIHHAREQAKIYGNEEQLRRLENGLLGQYEASEILDNYISETYQKSERK